MRASLIIHNIFFELYNISYNILKTKAITPVQETVINQCLKYIEHNYKNDLDIDTICNEVSFSKYYFCKLFKDHMGITIHQYVSEFRVNKSKELLTYSKLSINAVAASVGYKNPLTYSRAFEKSMHMTPSEYRKNF
nr:AraC family transcriptional regulator [Murimonas intestini]